MEVGEKEGNFQMRMRERGIQIERRAGMRVKFFLFLILVSLFWSLTRSDGQSPATPMSQLPLLDNMYTYKMIKELKSFWWM